MSLTKNELMLISDMLSKLDDLLSNKMCNDFDFPDSWSKEELTAFVKDYHDYNGDPEEFDEDCLSLPDFSVAGLLSNKVKSLAEGVGDNDISSTETPFNILYICTAYEQGYGKGLDLRKCVNPYSLMSDGWHSWNCGYSEGANKRADEALKKEKNK